MSFRWSAVKSYVDLLWYLIRTRPQTGGNTVPVVSETPPPTFELAPQPKLTPLYAIIIGINNYEHSSLTKLRGSVSDATKFKEYLTVDLHVPEDHITFLCNRDASRANIIDAFKNLKNDSRIKKNDPIVIYFAGHGGEWPPRDREQGAVSQEKQGEQGEPIQVIYPQDYNPPRVPAIRDRNIAALLDNLASVHGNNITVIFDCCHSGSGTRGDASDTAVLVRGAPLTKEGLPNDHDEGTRGVKIPNGFVQRGIRSHVLLAACRANELAKEDAGGGWFTVALLKLLRSTGAEKLVYADALCRIDPIIGQNPQCEGYHRNRIFFDAKARSASRLCYDVKYEKGKYILQAGSAHGVTNGAEFTVYESKMAVASGQGLGVAKTGSIAAFTTTLTLLSNSPVLPTLLPNQNLVAVQTKVGDAEDFLLHIPMKQDCLPLFEAVIDELQGVGRNPCRVTLVPREKAHMEMTFDKNGYTFATCDPRLVPSGISRLPHTLEPTVDADKLRRVLRAAAHYNFHLRHTQANTHIPTKISIQFKRLFQADDVFDDDGNPIVTVDEKNLVEGGKIDFAPDEDAIYGFEITNGTPWDLYFHCLYFDSMDLSISALTPVVNRGPFTQDFMLASKGGKGSIGYGSLGIPPVSFDAVPEGLDAAAGFFKFYFTTEALDLSHLPQSTPFEDTRGAKTIHLKAPSTWGTIVLPAIQRRSKASSL